MNRIKNIIVSLILILTVSSCGNKAPRQDALELAYHDSISRVRDSIERAEERNRLDSIIREEEKLEKDNSSSYHSNSSGSSHTIKQDNMRGFDPASEDDMDDNGMSRYMENDDEEGWD